MVAVRFPIQKSWQLTAASVLSFKISCRPCFIDELDSYMYQTVGHQAIDLYAKAMRLPLYRRYISGIALSQTMDYEATPEDEVEDLYDLLKEMKDKIEFDAIAVGAIM